jgi:hypothetical protein
VRAVTKQQFERMVAGMGPRAANADKVQLAEYYMRALLVDNETRRLKIDQDPAVAEALWMSRIGVVGDALHRYFQKTFAARITEAEVSSYYEAHKNEFEEAAVRRVVIPKPTPPAKGEKPADGAPATEAAPDSPSAAKSAQAPAPAEIPHEQLAAARKAYAEKLLARARAGEDLDKLQKEAFTTAKLDVEPPDTNPVPLRRGQLPESHEEKVFAAKAGEFTALFDEPSAYLFYKIERARSLPLAEAREEVRKQLVNEKEDEAIKKVFTSGKPRLNPVYFAPSAPAQPAPQPEAPPAATERKAEEPKAEPPATEAPKTESAQPPAEAPKYEAAPPGEPPKAEAPAEPPK